MDDLYDKAMDHHLVAIMAFFAAWSVALLLWIGRTPPALVFGMLSVLFVFVLARSIPKMVALRRRAQASWVANSLEELTGRRYPVRPVVVFPGWFVERAPNPSARDVWVLEPKELRGWLAREPHMIPPKDVALIHSRLKLVARGGA